MALLVTKLTFEVFPAASAVHRRELGRAQPSSLHFSQSPPSKL